MQQEYTSPFPPQCHWHQCYLSFLQRVYRRRRSEHSARTYHGFLRHFFDQQKPPDEYTTEDVERFINRPTRHGKPAATSTINGRLTAIASFYKYAAIYRVPGEDGKPRPLLQTPSPTLGITYGQPAQQYRAFSMEELQKLFAVIPRDTVAGCRDRALFVFILMTGRRRSEVARLRYGDISFGVVIDERGERRDGWLYRYYGKGHAEQQKTRELPELAKKALDSYLKASGRTKDIGENEPLFITTRGKRTALTGHAIAFNLKRYVRQAGLDESRLSLHSLRHTAAQQRLEAGQDILSLMNYLDHQNLGTTYRYVRRMAGAADTWAGRVQNRFAPFL